jgi:hypothetical protein
MKHKMTILFYTKSAKATKNGLLPIYLRITINGTRIELSTSRYVEKSKWNNPAGKIKGDSEETRLINSHLDILNIQIINYKMELVHKKNRLFMIV